MKLTTNLAIAVIYIGTFAGLFSTWFGFEFWGALASGTVVAGFVTPQI